MTNPSRTLQRLFWRVRRPQREMKPWLCGVKRKLKNNRYKDTRYKITDLSYVYKHVLMDDLTVKA